MKSPVRMRTNLGFVLGCLITFMLEACSSGGGGSSGTSAGTPSNTQPGRVGTATHTQPGQVGTATQTRTGTPATATTTFTATRTFTPGPVGTPTRTPTGPTATPTGPTATPSETPTPTEVVIVVKAPQSISRAARNAPGGATIIVQSGSYAPVVLTAGQLNGPITLLADLTGFLTEGPAGDVTINGGTSAAAVSLDGQTDLTIDGFSMTGGTQAALLAKNSSGLVVIDCTATRSKGDGIRLEQSDSSLVLNNLVYGNTGTGIRLLGVDTIDVVNNTIYGSSNGGIFVGGDPASANLFIQNNIFNKNKAPGMAVDSGSSSTYQADFNLNSDGYGTDTPMGENDINGRASLSDPQFFSAQSGDFHLSATSPAVDAGNFDTNPDDAAFLETLTTQKDGTLDTPPVDMGFHYLPPSAFATPTIGVAQVPTPTPRRP